ncbi:MAG: hypothetical protein ACLGI6_07415 [Gammaproteobacteria bacterium]
MTAIVLDAMIECNRTLEQARRDFAAGRITSAALLRVPMSRNQWTLQLLGAKGDSGMLLAVPSLDTHIFTSLDQAVETMELIGLQVEQLTVRHAR